MKHGRRVLREFAAIFCARNGTLPWHAKRDHGGVYRRRAVYLSVARRLDRANQSIAVCSIRNAHLSTRQCAAVYPVCCCVPTFNTPGTNPHAESPVFKFGKTFLPPIIATLMHPLKEGEEEEQEGFSVFYFFSHTRFAFATLTAKKFARIYRRFPVFPARNRSSLKSFAISINFPFVFSPFSSFSFL